MLLMHKDIPVAQLTVTTGAQIIAARVLDRSHMPIGTYADDPNLAAAKLRIWLGTRMIPGERQDKGKLVSIMMGCSVRDAAVKAMCVSLTDSYWLRDEQAPRCAWKDIDYHTNGFSQELASAILTGNPGSVQDLRSPDLTTDGALKKTWVMDGEIPSLIKFGDFGPNAGGKNLLSANEVTAYRIACMMGINHAVYTAVEITGTDEIACITPCFIRSPHEEFVTAQQIAEEYRLDEDHLYDGFAGAGMKREIDDMILFDHIIHNTDRHERNFGVIRDPDTLEITGFAPLFDSGSSLGWQNSQGRLDMGETKPFRRSRMEQLRLLTQPHLNVPGERSVIETAKAVYEEFGLPEQNFLTARADILKSYDLLYKWRGERL